MTLERAKDDGEDWDALIWVSCITEPWHWCPICGSELGPFSVPRGKVAELPWEAWVWCDQCNKAAYTEAEVDRMQADITLPALRRFIRNLPS